MSCISAKIKRLSSYYSRYATVTYKCAIPDSVIPEMVSLVREECETATNVLRVIDTGLPGTQKPHDIAVCASGPLHYNYGDGKQLINFIESNRALGVNYFYFYNHSAGCVLLPYLKKYMDEGIVELIQWEVPVEIYVSAEPPPTNREPLVHYFGQVAALQDCLHRSIKSAKFLVNLDVDELIVPYQEDSQGLLDLLTSTLGAFNNQLEYGAYIFASSFFPTSQPRAGPFASHPQVIKYGIRPVYHLSRHSRIYPHRDRSKYIVHPERVEVLGIHFIYSFAHPRWKTYNVPTGVALLHHHRDVEEPDRTVADTSVLKFAESIVEKVAERHEQFGL